MAIININANLNGGDDTTPDNELFYRIYGEVDAYASPIHTTGTAITDADVTVTGDVVDISNVDGTTNTSFKIAAVDGSGNEGILSDAFSMVMVYALTFDGGADQASRVVQHTPAIGYYVSMKSDWIGANLMWFASNNLALGIDGHWGIRKQAEGVIKVTFSGSGDVEIADIAVVSGDDIKVEYSATDEWKVYKNDILVDTAVVADYTPSSQWGVFGANTTAGYQGVSATIWDMVVDGETWSLSEQTGTEAIGSLSTVMTLNPGTGNTTTMWDVAP